MRNLHDIHPSLIQAFIWAQAHGRNGRPLGPSAGNIWAGLYHAYNIERGTPYNRVNSPESHMRTYWHPWRLENLTLEQRLTPACGRIRSQSRSPRMTAAYEYQDFTRCPDCARLAPTTQFHRQLQVNDPWIALTPRERPTTPDPVSGL